MYPYSPLHSPTLTNPVLPTHHLTQPPLPTQSYPTNLPFYSTLLTYASTTTIPTHTPTRTHPPLPTHPYLPTPTFPPLPTQPSYSPKLGPCWALYYRYVGSLSAHWILGLVGSWWGGLEQSWKQDTWWVTGTQSTHKWSRPPGLHCTTQPHRLMSFPRRWS